MRIRAFSFRPLAQKRPLPPAAPASDEERAFADWEALRRLAMTYIPLLALAPVLAGAVLLLTD